MRIVINIMSTSQEKAVRHYVAVIVKIFEEHSEVTQGDIERQLWKYKSGVCLDQNWMFVDRGEERGWGHLHFSADVINE